MIFKWKITSWSICWSWHQETVNFWMDTLSHQLMVVVRKVLVPSDINPDKFFHQHGLQLEPQNAFYPQTSVRINPKPILCLRRTWRACPSNNEINWRKISEYTWREYAWFKCFSNIFLDFYIYFCLGHLIKTRKLIKFFFL